MWNSAIRYLLFVCLILGGLNPVSSPGGQGGYVADNNRAVELLNSGDYLGGIELLRQSLQQNPYDESVRNNLRNAYLAAGTALTKQQQYLPLVDLMREAQLFDDSQRRFWIIRGHALSRLKRYDEAEIDLLEAQSMGDQDPQLLYMLGQIYYLTDRMHEAYDALESAALLDPRQDGINEMLEKVRRELAVERTMDKEYGSRFVINFDGEENSELGREVLSELEEAYNELGARFNHFPEQRVTVILYSRRQFSELTRSPDWVGGLYDGKIRLPVGGISRVDGQVRKLLYHEYTHVILRDILGDNIPTWLNEGLAENLAGEVAPDESEPPARSLNLEGKRLFPLKDLEGSFSRLSGEQARMAYVQSAAFVHFLIDGYGWYLVRELVVALADGLPIADAVDRVFGIHGMNYQMLEKRWRASL